MNNVIRYFKALSDETRLRLVCILKKYELSVNELVSILEMGQSRVSRHLKILTEAGLLSSRRDGLWVFYSAATEGEGHEFLSSVISFMQEEVSIQTSRPARASRAYFHCLKPPRWAATTVRWGKASRMAAIL